MKGKRPGGGSVQMAEEAAARIAAEQALELVEVTLQKEPQGKTLCIYIDQPNGVSLDDCERFHKAVQPLLEAVEYDFLEVSSPGVDRPIKTQRDFEKNRGALVEVKLFAPIDGAKLYQGTLQDMDEADVSIALADGNKKALPRKSVALIKPVIIFEDDDDAQTEQ